MKTKIKIHFYDDLIIFYTKYDKELIATLKEIRAIWNKKQKIWIIDLYFKNKYEAYKNIREKLIESGKYEIEMTETFKKWYSKMHDEYSKHIIEKKILKILSNACCVDDVLKQLPELYKPVLDILQNLRYSSGKRLLPHQEVAVLYYLLADGKVINADDTGLGKTITTIVFLNTVQDAYPALIVCPSNMKYTWLEEWKEWTEDWYRRRYFVFENGKQRPNLQGCDLIILNYELFRKEEIRKQIEDLNIKTLIIDEAQRTKNFKALRTKALVNYAYKKRKELKYKIALTGTLIVNSPMDVFSVLRIIRPDIFPSRKEFLERYTHPDESYFGKKYGKRTGIKNSLELQTILRENCMIRRKKEDCLALKEKIRMFQVLKFEGDDSKLKDLAYQVKSIKDEISRLQHEHDESYSIEVKRKIKEKIQELKAEYMGKVSKFEEYRKDAAFKKLPYIVAFVRQLLKQGRQVVIFAHHVTFLRRLKEIFGDEAVLVYGGSNARQKHEAVEKFQKGLAKVFIGGIRATGEGITLTAAHDIVFAEFDWTMAAHKQAEDRCYRIGQNERVIAWYLALDRTIDVYMLRVLEKKQKLLDALDEDVDSAETTNIFDDVIEIILEDRSEKDK